ncbi:hypothetical protein SAMN02745181_0409 [Rubritalea squalenifaciens DSM 18772]|uniref:Uncharacterized protein n=1 Tax=Rubritalea squalenifaciens DSM 18772 TaxID=1123071 RepID=A0A1M6C7L0_9BACT|nr:hypothetical protein SAMN02745181_0409 [Rubritalea squalenifaciens DSM 18772]
MILGPCEENEESRTRLDGTYATRVGVVLFFYPLPGVALPLVADPGLDDGTPLGFFAVAWFEGG